MNLGPEYVKYRPGYGGRDAQIAYLEGRTVIQLAKYVSSIAFIVAAALTFLRISLLHANFVAFLDREQRNLQIQRLE